MNPQNNKIYCLRGHNKDIVGKRSSGHCSECAKELHKTWVKTNRIRAWENSYRHVLKKRYNTTLENFYARLEKQNYCCKICLTQLRRGGRAHVDHCHDTEKIRGILCQSCNIGLGHFKDSQKFLQNAINYLKEVENGDEEDPQD